MDTFQLHSHQKDNTYTSPHFFIQSKGYNSGKPTSYPVNDCFVAVTNDELEKGIVFWTCFTLWKTDQFLPLLDKSPMPALNLEKANELIDITCLHLGQHPEKFLSHVREMKELIKNEKLLNVQLKLIKKVKSGIARKMLR